MLGQVTRPILLLCTSLGLWAIPTIATAHAGNDDPNAVHACIGNISKVVRIVGVNGTCITAPPLVAESAAHWAIQGPPGLNGTNGTNGINGTSVTFVASFTGSAGGCSNGGVIYAAGNPPVNAYVCNGTNATRADGPCFDNANRYVDCGNGTVTDTVTGLIWLKQWDCLPNDTFAASNQAAAGLKNGDCGLSDKSSPGDWRVPSKDEWVATIARGQVLGCIFQGSGGGPPPLTNDAGTACYVTGPSSFAGVAAGNYWSSTTDEANLAWFAHLSQGNIFNGASKGGTLRVWPVRGESR